MGNNTMGTILSDVRKMLRPTTLADLMSENGNPTDPEANEEEMENVHLKTL